MAVVDHEGYRVVARPKYYVREIPVFCSGLARAGGFEYKRQRDKTTRDSRSAIKFVHRRDTERATCRMGQVALSVCMLGLALAGLACGCL